MTLEPSGVVTYLWAEVQVCSLSTILALARVRSPTGGAETLAKGLLVQVHPDSRAVCLATSTTVIGAALPDRHPLPTTIIGLHRRTAWPVIARRQ